DFRLDERQLAQIDRSRGSVDGDDLTLLDHRFANREFHLVDVDVQRFGSSHARDAKAAGDDGGVRSLAASGREDGLGGEHAVDVVRVGFVSYENDLLSDCGGLKRHSFVKAM